MVFLGSVKKDIEKFSAKAKQRLMTALTAVAAELPLSPNDFKYMGNVGMGVYELRIKAESEYRVFYISKFEEAIYILHAFVKKTQQTSEKDLKLGMARYKTLLAKRKEQNDD